MASRYPDFDKLDFDSIISQQDVFLHIQCINQNLYEPVERNILYLAKKKHKTYQVHVTALRDTYSHLCKIIEYDIQKPEDKIKIKRQLERYLGHLEELLYDTYSKVIKLEILELLALFDIKQPAYRNRIVNKPKIFMKLAVEVQEARMMNDKIPIKDKIAKYHRIINYIHDRYLDINKITA